MDTMDAAFAKREVNIPDVVVAATLRIVERKRRAAESQGARY
jgi:hypothetical protein